MRAFLSLDGIVNGDIPMTAVSGFGFDLYGQRPIILRKQALNFGMRPNPEPRAVSIQFISIYIAFTFQLSAS